MKDLDFINQKYTNTKLSNLFLGFFEGLFIDGAIHAKEIKALITWVDTYPDCVNIPYFSTLYELLIKSYQEPLFLIDKKLEIQKVFHLFKNSKHFIESTADIQRLHGVLAGVTCDQNLRCEEVIALSAWLKARPYLNENFIYSEIMTALDKVGESLTVTDDVKLDLLNCIKKYINVDDYGLPLQVVKSDLGMFQNPDFYYLPIDFQQVVFCFTGASERYLKSEWKDLIEQRSGVFTDSLTKKVSYLVICNKGNLHWAHMSYGRKFEQARKMQAEGHFVKILTEDHFISLL